MLFPSATGGEVAAVGGVSHPGKPRTGEYRRAQRGLMMTREHCTQELSY